jgi:peptidoglycan-N-acetylglucosamine deacetylase
MRPKGSVLMIWICLLFLVTGQAASAASVYEQLSSGKRVAPKERTYIVPERPTVYLSFDDGPSIHTPQVLDILQAEGAKATFFILGAQAEKHPEWTRRIVKDGHAIGNHSFNHVYDELYSSFDSFWQQVTRTDQIIEELTGTKSTLLRAPGGTYANFDPFYFYYLQGAGFHIFDWNVDSGDARRKGVEAGEIVRHIRESELYHEVHVLMHDGTGHEETVKALPEIIRYYKEKGYQFDVLSPEVKPVVQSVRDNRWNRSAPSAIQFQHDVATVEGWARKTPERVPELNTMPTSTPTAVPAPAPAPALQLLISPKKISIAPETYRFEQGRFIVPLRLLAEQMGAKVAWEGDRRTAVVDYGAIRLEYRLSEKTLISYHFGLETVRIHLPDMELKEGSIYVPLRSTVERLGERVAAYHLDGERREVSIVSAIRLYRV